MKTEHILIAAAAAFLLYRFAFGAGTAAGALAERRAARQRGRDDDADDTEV